MSYGKRNIYRAKFVDVLLSLNILDSSNMGHGGTIPWEEEDEESEEELA